VVLPQGNYNPLVVEHLDSPLGIKTKQSVI